MKNLIIFTILIFAPYVFADTYIGHYSRNPYAPGSTANPQNIYQPYSITNPLSPYGNPYSNKSATNPYATHPPKLYDSQGNYRGNITANPYDPNSISNPYGRYGSPYSPDSIHNPYGLGNPYEKDSPKNPYGQGLIIMGD